MGDRHELARWTEADRSFGETQTLVNDAVTAAVGPLPDGQWLYIRDLGPDWVVWDIEGAGDTVEPGQYRASYTIDDAGHVALGTPEQVQEHTTYETVTESERLEGRIVESRGADDTGGRVFRVQILRYGTSRNRRRYTESVMRRAVRLYEGAKAYDHHRTDAEIATSTIEGLVGTYRGVEATTDGLYGDLHLLPSATHVAEAFEATLAAQAQGLPAVVGISHDVIAAYRPATDGGQAVQEATEIVSVNSADVVADPSAGGRVTRMVAGGPGDPNHGSKEETTMNLKQLLALLRKADAAERARLLEEHKSILDTHDLTTDDLTRMLTIPDATDEGDAGSGAGTAAGDGAGAEEPAMAGAATESYRRDSFIGRTLIAGALAERNLDNERFVEAITAQIPERFTEADLARVLDSSGQLVRAVESAGLTPTAGAQVTADEADKFTEALDAFFAGDYTKGIRSFKEAYFRFSGQNPYTVDDDMNRTIMRESIGNPLDLFDSGVRRAVESASSATWAKTLGDSITRRVVAEYQRPGLDDYKQIVSGSVPVNDFRAQRIDRVGGYGTLPTVAEGQPYQPLATPGEEEATYALTKKGGTEDLTFEAIANDDVRLISKIPSKLALTAARTIYQFVWDFLRTNVTCTYDSTALFDVAHSNTTAAALSNANLSAARAAMRRQAGFGDTADILSLVPRYLIVPPELEDLGNQLCNGRSAVPASTPGASDVPNLHVGTQLIVVDYFSDTDDWFLCADPQAAPTIELGFYQGRELPELFAQTDPTTGAVFNADKVTWKIRHIYSGTVVDHRGFLRRTQ